MSRKLAAHTLNLLREISLDSRTVLLWTLDAPTASARPHNALVSTTSTTHQGVLAPTSNPANQA